MCGIVAILEHGGLPDARSRVVSQAQSLRHRGPDWSGAYTDARFAIAHERLAIVDPESGEQPLRSADGRYVLAVNGEIYNHDALRHSLSYAFRTHSDCEVILPLYAGGEDFLDRLRGMFAFVVVDTHTGRWMIARDPMGVIPLYTGRDAQGRLYVSSEMKALVGVCTSIRTFPPGHLQTESDPEPVRWWSREWFDFDAVPEDVPRDPDALRDALMDSVRCHLMSDVPYGVLLSGGLDSSVISAIAARYAPERVEGGGAAWYPRLHSFSIGLQGSPDLAAAKVVADAIGTVHHGFTYTVEEGLDAISEAIRHLETYDVTTIRAGTPMFLMARKIKAMGIKMVLSGEGSDELFGGYLYFHKAPSARAFHEETVRKLHQLHLYDCNRANKAMAAWGVEARVPFLDTRFVDHAMRIPARHKQVGPRGIEKELLRTAFEGWLPDAVLWRQKEQFSDGVGYGWIDGLKARAARQVSDRQMAEAAERFPVGTPGTKEAYVYREIFDLHFPLPSAATTVPNQESVACSTSVALEWDAAFKSLADPSGRAVRGVHDDAY
ncbi:MAG: asparagine synthase B [Myxococcota bacterium]